MEFKDHALLPIRDYEGVLYETLPLRSPDGEVVDGLHAVRITLNNPKQYNSYTTEMVKGVIAGMRRASDDRACVAVVFTGAGDKAFCSGGNTAEYATYYAGRPEEYKQYMRLFNDMVSGILHCDKPVICRANGMRIGGGQEIGMACDYTIAQDLSLFGQAGPRHGSAPDGGSTDFLALFVGIEAAMESCTLCQPWTAHKAKRLGLIGRIVPALKVAGEFVPNPRGDHRSLDRRSRRHGLRRNANRRSGEEGEGNDQGRRSGSVIARPGSRQTGLSVCNDHARLSVEDYREHA